MNKHSRAEEESRAVGDLMSLGAVIDADAQRHALIIEAARRIRNWSLVAELAESEGTGPILYRHLVSSDLPADSPGLKSLRALAVRHRHATRARLAEVSRLSSALEEAGIASAALKGVALCALIYPEPGLRPMRDIDLLVHGADAPAARAVAERLGYRFEASQPSRYMRRHHHLPNATTMVDGLKVSLELHTSANSGDAIGAATLSDLIEPLQGVHTEWGGFRTLGHVDMLNQLCRHALEPGACVRLVSVMDIQGYCARFLDEIDWPRVEATYPYIPNFLGLLDLVVPLPPALERFAYRGPKIRRPGMLIPTLSNVFASDASRLRAIAGLVNPPEWWFKSYYGVDARGRGAIKARLRHFARLGLWAGRRVRSAAGL